MSREPVTSGPRSLPQPVTGLGSLAAAADADEAPSHSITIPGSAPHQYATLHGSTPPRSIPASRYAVSSVHCSIHPSICVADCSHESSRHARYTTLELSASSLEAPRCVSLLFVRNLTRAIPPEPTLQRKGSISTTFPQTAVYGPSPCTVHPISTHWLPAQLSVHVISCRLKHLRMEAAVCPAVMLQAVLLPAVLLLDTQCLLGQQAAATPGLDHPHLNIVSNSVMTDVNILCNWIKCPCLHLPGRLECSTVSSLACIVAESSVPAVCTGLAGWFPHSSSSQCSHYLVIHQLQS